MFLTDSVRSGTVILTDTAYFLASLCSSFTFPFGTATLISLDRKCSSGFRDTFQRFSTYGPRPQKWVIKPPKWVAKNVEIKSR